MKDKNANLNVMISKQKSMVNYEHFHLDENFHGIFLNHANMGKQKNYKNYKKKNQIFLH